ncbi:S1C family serine protease [Microbacterium sp. SYP-A9085]|jgi:putative serine protease PepD|uniref:S1C family serine protease n=1 Tax=Microbacterium sp. SYP-A9085 TaxID=2664454 RepID=UPI0020A62F3C|nr:trypsin-like peptidase domain-containing protein [Microbacterium sp. SYP-A9085]
MSENQDPRPEDVPAAPATPSAPPVPPLPPTPGASTAPTQPYPGQSFGIPAAQTPEPASTAPARDRRIGTGKVASLLVAAALVGGAAGLGGTWAGSNLWSVADSSPAAGPSVVTVNNTDSVTATTAIAAKVVPSVVTINVSAGSDGGTGSGVVLSKDGYVLTNTHVVTLDGQSATPRISVTTSDGHIYAAKIVGTDPVYDLAVIKLEGATDLAPVTWGDSGKLNVGDQTIAIGAPLGLSNTVTTGIVSALNRSIEIASSAAPGSGGDSNGDNGGQNGDSPFFFDFGQGPQTQRSSESIKIAVIQTDAPINPGNSGGALVDGQGRIVGINVAIASTGSTTSSSQSGSIGVGFSIPSDIAQRVAKEIIDTGAATHGLLGASVRDASSIQGATITGAAIVEVTAGGGADGAGLRAGDVVTAFNGVPVGSAVDLTAQVRAAAAGSKATVTYVRDGASHTTDVTLGTLK